MSYTIKLPQFEGPFDLLLFFIERDELDIYNIPIAKITDDFLDYLRQLQVMNIDVASEFILVASTLMRIKARLLLPRREVDEQGNEIDPRQELVQRLLEYKQYKEILEEIRQLEEERLQKEKRGNVATELQRLANQALAEAELESVTSFRLLKAFEKVMQDFQYRENRPVHTVVPFPYSIEAQREYVMHTIRQKKRTDFIGLFEACENRIQAIFTFLAMLELLSQGQLELTIGEGINNFWVSILEETNA